MLDNRIVHPPGSATPPIASAMSRPGRPFCGVRSTGAPLPGSRPAKLDPVKRQGEGGLPPLLPAPRRAERRAGRFRLRDGMPIVLGSEAGDDEARSAFALRDALRASSGCTLAVETHARRSDLGERIELACEGAAGEAYRVRVDAEAAHLVGAGPAGLRYAAETLAQLADARGSVPACEIEDAPDFPLRGVMLDVSRGKVPTLDTLRGLVDLCVRLKLNVLMLYVEHVFRFRRHPQIGADASPLTAGDLRELDAYAAERHVQLVPSLQSLGHMDHVLEIPAYEPLAEGPRRWTLSPAEPGSYELLADLYDEYLPNFRSRLFNANCDEPFDLGSGKSAARHQELGPGGVYLEHVRRVRDLAGSHGKRTLIWGDVVHAHPERVPEIDRDLILLDWWYEADCDYDRVKRFREAGLEFWVCPGTSSWNCLFPRVANSLENIRGWAEAGRRHGARGLLVTDWGDFGHYNLLGASSLAYAWAAEQAWGGRAEGDAFDRAFSRVVFADPSGRTARLFRELGDVHDAGYHVANGSVLQFLFFDSLDDAFFVQGAKPAALRRSLRRLERVLERLERAKGDFRHDQLARRELLWAARASHFAARKTLAGLALLGWRRRPKGLDARGRRRLARELAGLAQEQVTLGRELHRLWLARSRPSNFELTKRRLDKSVRSLRAGARSLERGRPRPPPSDHPGYGMMDVHRALLRSLAPGAGR